MAPEFRNKRKICHFCADQVKVVDIKDTFRLKRYLTDRGKILSRRITGTCSKHQRAYAKTIKLAREMAMIASAIED